MDYFHQLLLHCRLEARSEAGRRLLNGDLSRTKDIYYEAAIRIALGEIQNFVREPWGAQFLRSFGLGMPQMPATQPEQGPSPQD